MLTIIYLNPPKQDRRCVYLCKIFYKKHPNNLRMNNNPLELCVIKITADQTTTVIICVYYPLNKTLISKFNNYLGDLLAPNKKKTTFYSPWKPKYRLS